MTTPVSDQMMRTFDETGFLILREVIDADLIAEASDHVQWLLDRHPERTGEGLTHDLVASDPFWVRLISDDRLLDVAECFLGPDLALFASHYIAKPPFTGKAVLWHQDAAYWPLEPMKVLTLWLAVDESTPANGCVRVIPGSHRQPVQELRERTDVDNVLGSEIATTVDEGEAVDLVLAPGDVEVHHPNIVHGSNANTSPRRRCGLTIRYIPTSTRIVSDEQPWTSAFWLRGEPGVNQYQPRPVYRPGVDFPFAGATS